MERTNTILLIGRPGSGKGTQAKLLSEQLGWIRLSSGDRIKQIRDGNEPFSARVRAVYDKGRLLPDWLADFILESSLLSLETHVGVVLEGFGRTERQAHHFHEIIDWLGRSCQVINLEVSEDEVIRRMTLRAGVEDRPDSDSLEKIRARLTQFESETRPALEYFRSLGIVTDVDGEQSPEEIARAVAESISYDS